MIPVEDGLAFKSKHAPLSNLHPCKIRHKENDFTSVEQGLQHEHAVTCKRDDIATKIMSTNDPEKIMQLTRGLPDSEEWNGKEVEVCTDLNNKKYEQNPHLKICLLATKGHLYEVTRNKKFYAGRTQQIKQTNVRGGNQLGITLEDL